MEYQDLDRWTLLRALEWANFPAFVSRTIAPVLFAFFPWFYTVFGIAVAVLLWCLVRYRFISVFLARLGVFVGLLAWPSALGAAVYLALQGRYFVAGLALVWPLLAGFIQTPAQIGTLQLAFAKRLGFEPAA